MQKMYHIYNSQVKTKKLSHWVACN